MIEKINLNLDNNSVICQLYSFVHFSPSECSGFVYSCLVYLEGGRDPLPTRALIT